MLIAIQGMQGSGKTAAVERITAGAVCLHTTNAMLSAKLVEVNPKTEYIVVDEILPGESLQLLKELVHSQFLEAQDFFGMKTTVRTPHIILISQQPLRPF